ncbi:MAG: 1-(5-phosphoribosyl)-5-[(5-phosphoribosylamino)methylideneamino] imidazole-4-carboxamide isomerase [Synergistaceae bacterium]|nr:1-(5-phosphoribosyl)-5-[(5-phosphoribosylamino)methylideneamino] imidazole-4-carboxamide isomerase [Synergistaceae bacterium]
MIIFPAIDLFDGKVVRLTQGDYGRRRDYALSPLDAAKAFLDSGCSCIHVVDLEGAKAGEPRHLDTLSQIAALGLFVQYGGGLRSAEAVARALSAGAGRVMAGSLIFKDIERAGRLAERFGEKIMAAIDIKDKKVVHSGWLEGTELSAAEAAERLSAMGFSSFLVTQTERDGMMAGTDAEEYRELAAPGRFIAAAGGVTSPRDISELAAAGVNAAVIGKSLYEGGITVCEALAAAQTASKAR